MAEPKYLLYGKERTKEELVVFAKLKKIDIYSTEDKKKGTVKILAFDPITPEAEAQVTIEAKS
jgi:hypothetical protein